jgi:methionyl-tRNA formyltransferase
MPSPGSAQSLQGLLAAGVQVVGVVAAEQSADLPSVPPAAGDLSIDELCSLHAIPMLWRSSLRDPAATVEIDQLEPDAIVSCCFPLLVPPHVLSLPALGCLNIHPSLLPAWRGVEPLFWPFRFGEAETGTTVHLMDERFDTGPVLFQQRVPIPDGVRMLDLERTLIEIGTRAFVDLLGESAEGRALPRVDQKGEPTRAPLPRSGDLVVRTDQPARWAYNFVRGVTEVYGPLSLQVLATGASIPVWDAIHFEPNGELPAPLEEHGDELLVQFHRGVVRFKLRPAPS